MEAGGVAAALHQTADRPEFLMIKGVSDFGRDKHDPQVLPWRSYAAHAAAAFARALIEDGPAGHAPPKDAGDARENDDLRAIERRWLYLQRAQLIGLQVTLLLKSPVGREWLVDVLDKTRVSFSRTGPSFKLGSVLSSAVSPNSKEGSPDWDEAIGAYWEPYEPAPGIRSEELRLGIRSTVSSQGSTREFRGRISMRHRSRTWNNWAC